MSVITLRNLEDVQVIIPARLASTRLPRKLLLATTGKTLLQHTYEAVQRAGLPKQTIVAVDDEELVKTVNAFGGQAVLTSSTLASGTDRVAVVAQALPEAQIIVNVQGDEPEIASDTIHCVIRQLKENPDVPMATLAAPLHSLDDLSNTACVKVVRNQQGRALYFSRAPIPFPRNGTADLMQAGRAQPLMHLGIYAYRRDFLFHLTELPVSALEQVEHLEQLRVLEAGFAIQVGIVAAATPGIDTPEDYAAFVERQRGGGHSRHESGGPAE